MFFVLVVGNTGVQFSSLCASPDTALSQQCQIVLSSGDIRQAGYTEACRAVMEDPNSDQNHTKKWREMVKKQFPEIFCQTCIVPHVHFNRVPYCKETVPGTGQTALVSQDRDAHGKDLTGDTISVSLDAEMLSPRTIWHPVPSQQSPTEKRKTETRKTKKRQILHSDSQDDSAHNHVITNLAALGVETIMFIISKLRLEDYLKQPQYQEAVKQLRLPLPADLDKTKPQRSHSPDTAQQTQAVSQYSRGEIDVLLFHPRRGVLVLEIKSVGRSHVEAANTIVAKRIMRAVEQLNRYGNVISHVVSDIAPGMTVKKSLFLPYVTQKQLQQVLESGDEVCKALFECLRTNVMSDCVNLCVCADQLSDPDTYWDVTRDVLSKLSDWWQHRMATDDPHLCGPRGEELYLDIVARFVGPASIVSIYTDVPPRLEVRTVGQAVAEYGRRLSRLVLTEQQLDIINRDLRLVCLTGPPGTGKTVVLALQGLKRLREGKDVHVISTDYDTLAASYLIQHQLNVTLQAEAAAGEACQCPPGKVFVHPYDFRRAADDVVEQAIEELMKAVREGTLCVIMDESSFHDSVTAGPRTRSLLSGLERLQASGAISHLYLWCACIPRGNGLGFLREEELSTPLRSAPTILREVRPCLKTFQDISDYSSEGFLAPGDGPRVVRMRHEGEHHVGEWPVACRRCGRDVAEQLKRLKVEDSPPLELSWRDMFVITRSESLADTTKDSFGQVTSEACGFVLGLRDQDVPVSVLSHSDYVGKERVDPEDMADLQQRIQDVAIGRCDRVTAAYMCFLDGLERRVVVWLVDGSGMDQEAMLVADCRDRLFKVSRCVSLLVVVDVPS